jgi:hypothetical protein
LDSFENIDLRDDPWPVFCATPVGCGGLADGPFSITAGVDSFWFRQFSRSDAIGWELVHNARVEKGLELVLGAVLGALVVPFYLSARSGVRWVTLRRRRRDGKAGRLDRRILDYYEKRGLTRELYVTRMVAPGTIIALLHDVGVDFDPSVDMFDDAIFKCDHVFERLPYSKSVLRWYRRGSARLFDGEFMRTIAVRFSGDRLLSVDVRPFNFYAYVTLCRRTQRELLSSWRRPKIHDRYLRSFRQALRGELQPQAVGCMVVVLLEGSGGIYLPIAQRSENVINGPGTRSVVPVFGIECNAVAGRSSSYGLTFYNFVREFCEELLDLEELIHMMGSRRVDPDWIFELPGAARVLSEARAGHLLIRRTGFGINPNDGIFNGAVIAHFDSPDFFDWLRSQAVLNWESAAVSEAHPVPFEFVRIDDPRIDEWASQRKIDPSSVFALDLAREYVCGLMAEP